MNKELYPNQRITYRFELNINGKIYLEKKDNKLELDIHLINISYEAIQVIFADNEFLFDFFNAIEDKNITIKTSFEILGNIYTFKHEIYWVKLFDVAERNFYISTTLKFKDREDNEKELLDLLYILDMQKAYFG